MNTIKRKLKQLICNRQASFEQLVPNENQYFKKIALCIDGYTHVITDIFLVQNDCDIVKFDGVNERYCIKEHAYTLEQLKELYEYVWFLPADYTISVEAISNVLLKLCKNNVDFILLSFLLEDAPEISVLPEAYANLVVKSQLVKGWRDFDLSNGYGHLQRLFCLNENVFETMKIETFFAVKLSFHNKLYYNHKEVIFDEGKLALKRTEKFALHYHKAKGRRTILVLPVFLMVGGVERNTVGVMNQLKDQYDFVTVVFEGLMKKNGSMHHQIRDCGIGLFDFAEALDYSQYLDALKDVRNIFQPDAVWVCNGSNWLCDNAAGIRKIFANTPIIDQEVYDTQAGWITRYLEPGIQSFDRFVAINLKINQKFVDEFHIPSDRVDTMYPVVNLNIINCRKNYNPAEMKRKYGIPEGKKIFAFIGRLYSQKRPDLLVKLICEINKADNGNHFIFIGNGDLKEEVKRLIQLNRIDNITMIDFINDMSEAYAFIDAIIFVSLYEGLPIVVLEGLIKGIPVLSTDVGDVKLVLENYQAGMIFKGGIHEDLKTMKEDFMHFKNALELYKESIIKQTDKIKNQFSVETISAQWKDTFEKAILMKGGDCTDE